MNEPAPETRMTFWGVGPRLFAATSVWFVLALALDLAMPDRFRMHSLSPVAANVIGGSLIVAGLLLYIPTALAIASAVRDKRLLTTGLFARIRHPLYAIALWLLTPGFCLLFRSWLILTTPAAFLLVAAILLPREEAALEARFGDAYRAHRTRTGLLWPRLWRP